MIEGIRFIRKPSNEKHCLDIQITDFYNSQCKTMGLDPFHLDGLKSIITSDNDKNQAILSDLNSILYQRKDDVFWLAVFKHCNKQNWNCLANHMIMRVFETINNPYNDSFFKQVTLDNQVQQTFLNYIKNNPIDTKTSINKFCFIKENNGWVDLNKVKKHLLYQIKYNNERGRIKTLFNFVQTIQSNYQQDFVQINQNNHILQTMLKHKNHNYQAYEKTIQSMIMKQSVIKNKNNQKQLL